MVDRVMLLRQAHIRTHVKGLIASLAVNGVLWLFNDFWTTTSISENMKLQNLQVLPFLYEFASKKGDCKTKNYQWDANRKQKYRGIGQKTHSFTCII